VRALNEPRNTALQAALGPSNGTLAQRMSISYPNTGLCILQEAFHWIHQRHALLRHGEPVTRLRKKLPNKTALAVGDSMARRSKETFASCAIVRRNPALLILLMVESEHSTKRRALAS